MHLTYADLYELHLGSDLVTHVRVALDYVADSSKMACRFALF